MNSAGKIFKDKLFQRPHSRRRYRGGEIRRHWRFYPKCRVIMGSSSVFLLIAFIFIVSSLYPFSLKDKFYEGEEGTYIITEQNQLVSLLHLHTKGEKKLLFEEISIPLHLAKKIDWKTWAEKGAPGHTSWILYEVDLEKNHVTECYSLTRKSWIPIQEMEAFLIPLISLELSYLSEEKRLQTGATPKPGKVENRPWGPPQVIEGKKIKSPEYDVYTAVWPIDQTDLSGKPIVLYFDKMQKGFPFPYWLQVRSGAIKFKMRALDSGTDLTSKVPSIPRRAAQFIGSAHKEKKEVILTINSPTYYNKLMLYAVDFSKNPKVTHLIPCSQETSGEMTALKIPEEKLNALLTPGHEYLWILSSDDPKMTVESPYLYIH